MGLICSQVSGLLLCAQLLAPCTANSIVARQDSLQFKGRLAVEANGVANIHISYNVPISGELSINYGHCDVPLSHPNDLHHHAAAAKNVFTAHKAAVEAGYLDFSESGYIRYVLNASRDIADEIDNLSDNYDSWYYDSVHFSDSTTYRTIDQGLNRLPEAFTPLVQNRTLFNIAVQELSYNETTDKRSIATLQYEASCKVALKYKTRFWEHLDKPIIGGCGSTSIPTIGSICYPSYNIKGTGPGVLLASYTSGTDCVSVGALTDEEHVGLVQRAMVEIHGDIAAEQYTGSYNRRIWQNDPFQAGDWAAPAAGQQALYLPAYFKTELKTIFVGEHTTYTHAWIWSALESSVRGTTQLLLVMGLVDEAKLIVDFWMARWIEV